MLFPGFPTTLGAKIIEKHFIPDKSIGEPNASFSLDKKEFTEKVKAVRNAEKSIGKVDYSFTEKMKKSRQFAPDLECIRSIWRGFWERG